MKPNEKAKHTPGPLEIQESSCKLSLYVWGGNEESNDGFATAVCQGPDKEGNAMLYAAAPYLLEALQDCLESLNRLPDAPDAYRVTCIQQARVAIAKALNQPL